MVSQEKQDDGASSEEVSTPILTVQLEETKALLLESEEYNDKLILEVRDLKKKLKEREIELEMQEAKEAEWAKKQKKMDWLQDQIDKYELLIKDLKNKHSNEQNDRYGSETEKMISRSKTL